MPTQIFVNLPVKDLGKTMEFFTALGYSFNKQFTDDKAACLVISDTIYAMLLLEPFFKSFTDREICDTSKANEALLCLSTDSRAGVDEMLEKALRAGAKEPRPAQDLGFMYSRGFQDPDGHVWEILWMDPANIQH